MNVCNKEHLRYTFLGKGREQEVEIWCRGCGVSEVISSSLYFKMWGYPTPTEERMPFDWLHDNEGRVGRDMMEKVKVSFIDMTNNMTLGSSIIPFVAITKLNIGDRLEFKEVGAIFGMFEIHSFAINQPHPEGSINLVPITAKAKIKLHQVNNEYVDSLLPF